MENFKEKYLEYKTKYLLLKKQVGGNPDEPGNPADPDKPEDELTILGNTITININIQIQRAIYEDGLRGIDLSRFRYQYNVTQEEFDKKGEQYYLDTIANINDAFGNTLKEVFLNIISLFYINREEGVRHFALIDFENQYYDFRERSNGLNEFKMMIEHILPNHHIYLFAQDTGRNGNLHVDFPNYYIFKPTNSQRTELDDILLLITFEFIKHIFRMEGINPTICNRNLREARPHGYPYPPCISETGELVNDNTIYDVRDNISRIHGSITQSENENFRLEQRYRELTEKLDYLQGRQQQLERIPEYSRREERLR